MTNTTPKPVITPYDWDRNSQTLNGAIRELAYATHQDSNSSLLNAIHKIQQVLVDLERLNEEFNTSILGH
jgi:hypothetical protein